METPIILRKFTSSSGLSLLEVLVSMIILAMGVAGLAPMLALSIDSNQISKQHLAASKLAIDALETYEEGAVPIPAAPHTGVESAIDGMYDRYTSVNDHASDATVPAGYSRVDIVVQWLDDDGKTKSVHQSALLQN